VLFFSINLQLNEAGAMHYNYTIIPINSQLALSPFIASNVLTEECSYLFMSEFMLHQLCVFFIYSFGALPSTCSLKNVYMYITCDKKGNRH